MYNRVGIMGRLAQDPEMRRMQGGAPMVTFTLAVDRDFKDKNTGERMTDWIDCVAWRRTGEFVQQYFRKGRMALVEGRLQVRDWVDRDGHKRRSTEVLVDEIYFCGDPPKREEHRSGYAAAPPAPQGYQDLNDDDGQLPF